MESTLHIVSIPRSEFWLFGLLEYAMVAYERNELFQFPARNSGCSDVKSSSEIGLLLLCFNSPLGILVVRTKHTDCQSVYIFDVSIPRSEFWLFGRNKSMGPYFGSENVSIPRSEFWLFGRRTSVRGGDATG